MKFLPRLKPLGFLAHIIMKKIIIPFVFISTIICYGDGAYFTLENDTLIKRADDDYTNGAKLEYVTDDGIHAMVSQTMYAPGDLRQTKHIVGDRPYCGMLIGGIGYEFFQDSESPWTNYGELDFGMIGPAAMCKDTQTMIHKLLNCRKPMGWDNQLHNEFVVNGQWWTKYNWYITDWMALVPKGGLGIGTIQDFGEVGCDLKIGWNIRPTANNDIMFSASRYGNGKKWYDKLSAWVYAGASERYYLYNHILEGTLFGHRDDEFGVDLERFVTEMRAGIVVKYSNFFATYYTVFRTHEYRGQKRSPDFGGIGVGCEW